MSILLNLLEGMLISQPLHITRKKVFYQLEVFLSVKILSFKKNRFKLIIMLINNTCTKVLGNLYYKIAQKPQISIRNITLQLIVQNNDYIFIFLH